MNTQIGSEAKLTRKERRERRLQDRIETKKQKRLALEQTKLTAEPTDSSVASVEQEPEAIADSVPPPPVSETRLIQPQVSSAGPKPLPSLAFIVTATTLKRHSAKAEVTIESQEPAEPELRAIDDARIWEVDGLRLLDKQLRSLFRSREINTIDLVALEACGSIEEFIAWVRRRQPKVAKGLCTLGGLPLWIRKNGHPTEEGRMLWRLFRDRAPRTHAFDRIVNGGIRVSSEMESLLGAA